MIVVACGMGEVRGPGGSAGVFAEACGDNPVDASC